MEEDVGGERGGFGGVRGAGWRERGEGRVDLERNYIIHPP